MFKPGDKVKRKEDKIRGGGPMFFKDKHYTIRDSKDGYITLVENIEDEFSSEFYVSGYDFIARNFELVKTKDKRPNWL